MIYRVKQTVRSLICLFSSVPNCPTVSPNNGLNDFRRWKPPQRAFSKEKKHFPVPNQGLLGELRPKWRIFPKGIVLKVNPPPWELSGSTWTLHCDGPSTVKQGGFSWWKNKQTHHSPWLDYSFFHAYLDVQVEVRINGYIGSIRYDLLMGYIGGITRWP